MAFIPTLSYWFNRSLAGWCEQLSTVVIIALSLGVCRIENINRQWDFNTYLAGSAALYLDLNPYHLNALNDAVIQLEISDGVGLPYLYQPLMARMLTPLLWIPQAAPTLWFAAKTIAYGVAFLVLMPLIDRKPTVGGAVLYTLLIVNYRGTGADLAGGNVATFEMLLLAVWLSGRHGHRRWIPAGAMAMLITIKPIPALLLTDDIHRRDWKALGACTALIVFLAIVQLVDGSLPHYFTYMRSMEFREYWDQLQQGLFNHSVTTALFRLTDEMFITQPLIPIPGLAPFAAPLVALGVLISVFYSLNAWEHSTGSTDRNGPAAAVLITGLLALSPRVAEYTMAWTVIPIVLLAHETWNRKAWLPLGLLIVGVACIQYEIKYSLLLNAGWWQAWIDHDTYGFLCLHGAAVWMCLKSSKRTPALSQPSTLHPSRFAV